MSTWLVPILTAIAGAIAVTVYNQITQHRAQLKRSRYEARTQLITTIIPALNSEGNTIFSSGTYRYVLATQLEQANAYASLCSKKEQAAANALKIAWRKAVPADVMVTAPVDISDENRQEIENRRDALKRIVEKRLRPIKAVG